jgi:hypothetical protein
MYLEIYSAKKRFEIQKLYLQSNIIIKNSIHIFSKRRHITAI